MARKTRKIDPRDDPAAPPKKRAGRNRPVAAGQPGARDIGEAPDIDEAPDIGTAPAPRRTTGPRPAVRPMASGDDIVRLARTKIGQTYVLGARAPMANPSWDGPWDCAEFVSWCVFQAAGVLYGTEPQDNPVLADAFTGFWAQQAQRRGRIVTVDDAAGIVGAAVLRRPRPGAIGHIVLSDGRGGTVEAHSSARGVIAGTLSGRRWDVGILVPGVDYLMADAPVVLAPAAPTLRLTDPLTRGDSVRQVQARLVALGFAVGRADGIYGPQTAHAVRAFQAGQGLVADGEVGPATRAALGL